MKKVWVLLVEHVPVWDGKRSGSSVTWVHGKGDSKTGLADMTTEWLEENSFKTEAAAIRSSYRAKAKYKDDFWDVGKVIVHPAEIPSKKLHYRLYRCYEVDIVDDEGNRVGETQYCYGTKKDAERFARREIKMMEVEK